jgi:hypothetical protein
MSHDESDVAFVYTTITRSAKLAELAYEALEDAIALDEYTAIFIDETGQFVEENAVREGLLKFAEEGHGPPSQADIEDISQADIEDIRRRLEEER